MKRLIYIWYIVLVVVLVEETLYTPHLAGTRRAVKSVTEVLFKIKKGETTWKYHR